MLSTKEAKTPPALCMPKRNAVADSYIKAIACMHLDLKSKFAEITAISEETRVDRDIVEQVCDAVHEDLVENVRSLHLIPLLCMYAYNGQTEMFALAYKISTECLFKARSRVRKRVINIIENMVDVRFYVD